MIENTPEFRSSQHDIIMKLRETLSRINEVRHTETRAKAIAEVARLEHDYDAHRQELQRLLGGDEADRIVLDLREEILGEQYD